MRPTLFILILLSLGWINPLAVRSANGNAELLNCGTCPPPPTYPDPFDPRICTGTTMTRAEAAQRLVPGASSRFIADMPLVARKRNCNSVSGCAAWETLRDEHIAGYSKADSRYLKQESLYLRVVARASAEMEIWIQGIPATLGYATLPVACVEATPLRYEIFSGVGYTFAISGEGHENPIAQFASPSLIVTAHCAQVRAVGSTSVDAYGTSVQYEFVGNANY